MAKPIRSTPELKGELADKFLLRMSNREKSKITKADRALSREIKENSPYFIIA